MHSTPRIQIAGIIDQREADMLIQAGVDHLGFPLGPGVKQTDLNETAAAQVISTLKPPVHAVLITYLQLADEIQKLCKSLGVRKVQIHGEIEIKELSKLRQLDSSLFIMKSLIVRNNIEELKSSLTQYEPLVDAFITDTYDPNTKQCGATGKTHDWNISRELVKISKSPIILAGGLHPGNVANAIQEVRPA